MNVSFYLHKIRDNFQLDRLMITNGYFPIISRFYYILQKYYAIIRNKRRISYLGSILNYDNRLTPAFLDHYVRELQEVDKNVDFKSLTTILDIGANIGQYSLTLGRLFPHLKIWSFEPNQEIFELLKENSRGFDNWKVFNLGLSQESTTEKFYFIPGKSAQGSRYPENAAMRLDAKSLKEIQVNSVRLDKPTTKSLGIPIVYDYIKIDVEGYELEVLLSLKEIQFRYLFIELSTQRRGSMTVNELVNLVQNQWKSSVKILSVKPFPENMEILLRLDPHNSDS